MFDFKHVYMLAVGTTFRLGNQSIFKVCNNGAWLLALSFSMALIDLHNCIAVPTRCKLTQRNQVNLPFTPI